jgi:hypothetical protein
MGIQRPSSNEGTALGTCLAPGPEQQTAKKWEASTQGSGFMQQEYLSIRWRNMHRH